MDSPYRSAGRRLLPLIALFAGGCGAVSTTSTDRFTETGELIALSGGDAGAASACISCHGLDGLGNGAGTPRLAGLGRGYLEAQLEAYADGRRQHPEMAAIAKKLDAGQRQAVSDYCAALPFAPAIAMPEPTRAAAALYQRGDPSRGLLSCASCHGVRGEGLGPANPPLGGQPAAYLAEQLEQWRDSRRRNDPANIMLEISRRLSRREVEALADYASALPGGLPHPGSPAAYREARRGDPRSDASAPPPRGAE